MMKKLTAVLLLTAMTAGLAACGSNKGADTNTDTPAQNESTEELKERMTVPENYSHRSRLAQMWTSSFPQH